MRFYTALALHDLVNEVPIFEVCKIYGGSKGERDHGAGKTDCCASGMLQSLQQMASTFAGMVSAFCAKLGWNSMDLLVGQFQERLEFGVRRELIDLCRLETLNGQRARMMHKAGIESIAELAQTPLDRVEDILHNAAPFESKKKGKNEDFLDVMTNLYEGDDETESERKKRTESRCFWVTGRKGMTFSEAARAIVEEARESVERDLGIVGNWIAEPKLLRESTNILQKY